MGWLIVVEVVLMELEDDLIGFPGRLKIMVFFPSSPFVCGGLGLIVLCRIDGCYWSIDTCSGYFDYHFQVGMGVSELGQ